MLERLKHFLGWKLARFFFWLDRFKFSPASIGNRICDWMEHNHVCCDRHGYRGTFNGYR